MQPSTNAEQQSAKPLKNKKVANYVVFFTKRLGKGQYGQVYKAQDSKTNEYLAVKVFKQQKVQTFDYMKTAIINEVKIMQNLNSPNIIKFKGVQQTSNNIYIFQELAEDGTLADYLHTQPNRRLKEKQSIQVLVQLLTGMKQLINNQIIHRDVKLTNFLVKNQNNQKIFKIADFGLSKYTAGTNSIKTIVGTPCYMAPQLIVSALSSANSTKYTSKCDIWSFGVVAYQLVTGIYPWRSNISNLQELLEKIKQQCLHKIDFPQNIQISENYKKFIRGCLQYEEKDRFDWNDVFHHPLFSQFFNSVHFGNVGLSLADLRIKIHADNLNLQKLVAKLPNKSTKDNLFHFLKSVNEQITQKQSQNLFKKITKSNEEFLTRQEILNFFKQKGVELQGLKPKVFPNQQQKIFYKNYQLSKRLAKYVEQNNLDLFIFYKKFGFVGKNPRITRDQFNYILKNICKNLSAEELDEYFQFFNIQKTASLPFESFYEQLCQAAQVPALKDQKISNQIKKIEQESKF